MHHTRKNRSLKKKSKALKKKSNKSSRKSKKSRRVHKRRIGGGVWPFNSAENKPVIDFQTITENIQNSENSKSLSERVDAYIAATKHINLACKTNNPCNLNKTKYYGERALLGKSLQKELQKDSDVSEEQQKALELQTNEWGRLAIEKKNKVDFENKSPKKQAEHVNGLLEDSGFNPSSQS